MKDFQGYLLVFDMDGTLLDSNRHVSEESKQAIKEWTALGGEVCLASGRSAQSLRPYYEELGCKNPVICGNGSGVYDFNREEFLYHVNLPDGGREIARAADENLPHTGITIYKDGKVYFSKINSVTKRNIKNENLPLLSADYKTLPYPWEKILFCQESEHTDKVRTLMENMGAGEKYRLLKSAPVYFEILNPDANKGKALKWYCTNLGFDMEKTVAVGDNENDVLMLETAGYSFTVSNCTPAARSAAQYIVGSNDMHAARMVIDKMKELLKNRF